MNSFSHRIIKGFRAGAVSRLLQCAVSFYQKWISPLKGRSCCRFYPSCSSYALEALKTYGAAKGTAMSVWRILRCNPFCMGGFDPVVKEALPKR